MLRVTGCVLRVASYVLRVASYGQKRIELDIAQWKVLEDQKSFGNDLSMQSDFRHL